MGVRRLITVAAFGALLVGASACTPSQPTTTTPTSTSTTLANDLDHDGYAAPADCDDTDPAVNPGATEVLGNTVDDNCDGYADSPDYGTVGVCQPGTGRYADGAVYPTPEIIDGLDNDCNGIVDDV